MLAAHPELQEQIRAEIRTALETSEGRLDYGQVMGLPWLSAVIKETLRLYAIRRLPVVECSPHSPCQIPSGSICPSHVSVKQIPAVCRIS
jgi:cytochrome P450